MLRWLKNLFRTDKGAKDYRDICKHIDVCRQQAVESGVSVVSAMQQIPGTDVWANTNYIDVQNFDTNCSTTTSLGFITDEELDDMIAKARRHVK